MLTEVFGVSSSIVFAKNGGYAVITQGVKTKSKQLYNQDIIRSKTIILWETVASLSTVQVAI